MKWLTERNYHELFEAGIILKAASVVVEIISGIILSLITSDALNRVILSIFGSEINERPEDTFWKYVFQGFQGGISPHTQSLWAFLLLSHGIVKIIPIVGIMYKKLWAYPLSAVIFIGFIVYQIFQIMAGPSLPLEALTAFDAIVVVLILHEYRHKRRSRATTVL